jgi:hypothetical protein
VIIILPLTSKPCSAFCTIIALFLKNVTTLEEGQMFTFRAKDLCFETCQMYHGFFCLPTRLLPKSGSTADIIHGLDYMLNLKSTLTFIVCIFYCIIS